MCSDRQDTGARLGSVSLCQTREVPVDVLLREHTPAADAGVGVACATAGSTRDRGDGSARGGLRLARVGAHDADLELRRLEVLREHLREAAERKQDHLVASGACVPPQLLLEPRVRLHMLHADGRGTEAGHVAGGIAAVELHAALRVPAGE